MSKLDTIIAGVNGDLQDCLAPVAARFRQAMSEIFDYCVANPAQGNPTTAQTAIATAFKVHYPDGLISPGITIEQGTLAFVTRHGVGATTALKWVSVRDFIVARSGLTVAVLRWLEEGELGSIPDLWYRKISGHDPSALFNAAPDVVYQIVRNTGVPNTDPEYGLELSESFASASLGKTVQRTWTRTVDGNGNTVRTPGAWEVI